MAKVYIGGVDRLATESDIQDEFKQFGSIRTVWVARKPPGFAFVEFDNVRDAEDAIRKLDGVNGWRVEMSRKTGGPGPRGPPRRDFSPRGDRGRDYEGGYRGGGGYGGRGGGYGGDRGRDREDYGRDRGYDRNGGDRYGRRRSPSPRRSRSPGRRSYSPAGRARGSPTYN